MFLPGRPHGQRSLVGYSPRGGKESDMTERLSTHTLLSLVGPEQQAGSPSERKLAVAGPAVILQADCCPGLGRSCTWYTFWSYLPAFSGSPWGQWLFVFLICKGFIKLTVGPSSVFSERYNFGRFLQSLLDIFHLMVGLRIPLRAASFLQPTWSPHFLSSFPAGWLKALKWHMAAACHPGLTCL